MIAVPGYSHLFRRGAVYWFRRRVPKDLLAALPFAEWKASLGTKSLEEAKRLVRLRGVETDKEITSARARQGSTTSPPLTVQQAQEIAQGALSEWLAADAEERLTHGPQAWDNTETVLTVYAADYREALAMGDWQSVARDAALALEQAGLWYPDGDPSRRMMAGELLRVRVQYVDALARRQGGEIVETPHAPVVMRFPASTGPQTTLGTLIDDFRAKRIAEHGEPSTDRKYSHVFKALEEALGRDRPIREITRADCRGVQELVRAIPTHAGKRYPGLSLKDAVDAGRRDGASTLAPNTVAAYLQNLAAVFNWAVGQDLLDKSPARDLVKKGAVAVRRRGFRPDELEVMFAAFAVERANHPWRYWVPALGLYTGARANELCQLRVDDIDEAHGIACLDFSTFDSEGRRVADKRLKTAASERKVPLPRALIEAGFLAFVAEMRASGSDRLFPDLRKGPDGTYSSDLSKWFAKALGAVKLSSPSLVFHSFRHGFRDACREAEVTEETTDALGGWTHRGQGTRYGEAERMRLLSVASDKIKFGDFRLPDASTETPTAHSKRAAPVKGRGGQRQRTIHKDNENAD